MIFTSPYGLILLLVVPFLLYLSRRSSSNSPLLHKRILLILRITVIVLFILGISGFSIKRDNDKVCTIFLLDVSGSMSGLSGEDGIDIIKDIVKLKDGKQQFGLVVFAGNASVEISPTCNFDIKQIDSVVDKNYTNLEDAVDLAISIFPEDTINKIVCITDGNQNQSDVIAKAIEAKTRNITIDVITPDEERKMKEIWINDVISPQRVHLNQKFHVIVNTKAIHDNANGALKMYKNGVFEGKAKIELKRQRGKNIYFEQTLMEKGLYQYEFVLESNDDIHPENNIAGLMVDAGSKPRILYVGSESTFTGVSGTIHFPDSFEVESVTSTSFHAVLGNIWQYDLVIFQDIPASDLSKVAMEALNSYVRDQGGGFIMLGGLKSLSPGGYSETIMEQMLPVYLDPEPGSKGEGLSLVFAIDKSGSMAQLHGSKTKLRVVIDTIGNILNLLKKEDKLGIVLFDKVPGLVLPIQKFENFQEIENRLNSLEAQGGTDIFKSLKTSYELFKESHSKFKHIILVSDGQTDKADYSELLKAMREREITLSTIGIGDNVNNSFLESIATQCNGRSYVTRELDNLVGIFKRETAMASRSWFKEGELVPRIFQSHEIVKGISAEMLPSLQGLMLTSSKSHNNDIIVSGKSTPVLSSWQYGLGRTTILATDLFSEWGNNWFRWKAFPQFWSQLVRWNSRSVTPGQWEVKTELYQDKIRIILKAVNEDGSFENFLTLKGTVITPEHTEVTIDLKQTGSGKYEGYCPAETRGFYLFNLFLIEERKVILKQSSGIFIASLPEYMKYGNNWTLLEKMCRLTGGKCYNNATELNENVSMNTVIPVTYDCRVALILIALFLFVIEIAIRRLLFKI
ncbi:von Willebrand factor type A domain protein [Candidatus Brocadiaceae bacterium S225]|nr:von Willebrand factor type A domain protein [Candidatus Brocadiaceae bacterium S225]